MHNQVAHRARVLRACTLYVGYGLLPLRSDFSYVEAIQDIMAEIILFEFATRWDSKRRVMQQKKFSSQG
jgi:hypothetical protein